MTTDNGRLDIDTPICGIIDTRTRVLLMAIRQALIIALGAIEDYLNVQRSIVPKRKRN